MFLVPIRINLDKIMEMNPLAGILSKALAAFLERYKNDWQENMLSIFILLSRNSSYIFAIKAR